jgi:hypothetical protein
MITSGLGRRLIALVIFFSGSGKALPGGGTYPVGIAEYGSVLETARL